MKRSKKVQQIAADILKAFEQGTVPRALAQVLLRRHINCPATRWSWSNRLLIALRGHYDARGYRQWQQVGRQVKKGERAAAILAPRTIKAKEDDEERGIREGDPILVGWVPVSVFGFDQTEGEPLPGMEDEVAFIDALPLVEVARSWGLEVGAFDASGGDRLGFYQSRERIGLGVKNLATWAHELVHAADDRLGNLSSAPGQQLGNEVVAELGGAVLLECLGFTDDSDRGGAFAYIETYAKKHERPVLAVCTELLDRTCACVTAILEAAEEEPAAACA